MTIKEIESITYLLKQAKDCNKPKPIVFLGAGASASAGIPLTAKIISDILEKFKDKPEIKKLTDDERKDYYKVMGSLETYERHELLRGYIENENVKINVTHIYLAQMLKEGYIDYIVTVNFDDLLLKACALYNFIPAVYDIAILKDFTTTTLQKRSVTYLHGQYHGLWLLNTPDELNKVKAEGHDSITNVFRQICNERAWIIAGYSGEDGILDKIANLATRFDNNLYWVGYKENLPSENVQKKLLDKPNSNTYWIKGYDSDSFFLKLHSELKLDTPEIFNKPFSFLNKVVNNIKDIEINTEPNTEHKELLKQIEERFATSKNWINDAVERYENSSDKKDLLNVTQINKDDLKQEIIEAGIKNQFDKIDELNEKAKVFAPELNIQMSNLYLSWGVHNFNSNNHDKSIICYNNAILLQPNFPDAYFNLGISFHEMKQYKDAINSYKKAIELRPNSADAYNNIGNSYDVDGNLQEAIKSFEKAIELKPGFAIALNNLGNLYSRQKEFKKALICFKEITDHDSKDAEAYFNIGNTYYYQKEYDIAIEYYEKVITLNKNFLEAYTNIAAAYSRQKKYDEAIRYGEKALKVNPNSLEALISLGATYTEMNELSKAVEYIEKQIKLYPDYSSGYASLGFILIKSGDIIGSEEKFLKAIQLGDKSNSYMNLGHFYLWKREEELALDHYRTSLMNYDDKDDFWNGMKDDFQYLVQYGITQEYYEGILEKIKKQ